MMSSEKDPQRGSVEAARLWDACKSLDKSREQGTDC
jgi:hypothetical protein